MGILLGVNIDHVATLRQARGGSEPSVIDAALICERCGVNGITIHLREDRRHIQDADLFLIKERISIKLNLEMALSDDVISVAKKAKPYMVTIVPEKRMEVTTEGGLDVVSNFEKIKSLVEDFKQSGIASSLFIEPDMKTIDFSNKTGAEYVEFHTGSYSLKTDSGDIDHELKRLYDASSAASSAGLIVNAGHGLNYTNVIPVLKMEKLHELNIGHSIISRSVFTGLENAVIEMKNILDRG